MAAESLISTSCVQKISIRRNDGCNEALKYCQGKLIVNQIAK